MKFLEKGYVIKGPDGQGYTVTRAINPGDVIYPDMFEPFGGAPVPVAGGIPPEWVTAFLAGRLDEWLVDYARNRTVT